MQLLKHLAKHHNEEQDRESQKDFVVIIKIEAVEAKKGER